MPELPEVETIKRGLKKVLIGRKIVSVKILDKKRFSGDVKEIIGQEIIGIQRRAKLIIIKFANNKHLVIHLKMTGQLIFKDKTRKIAGGHQSDELFMDVPNKYTRIIFNLSQGGKLFYNDLIRYGLVKVLDSKTTQKMLNKEFGPEPFSKNFNKQYLKSILDKSRKSNIKKILMDQKKIAGLGNIYTNEALFFAGIDPRKKAKDLKDTDIEKLYKGILKALKLGIKHLGASIRNYVDHNGKKGKMQEFFKVYNRAGQRCECNEIIKKIQLGGRGTYYCPKCQK